MVSRRRLLKSGLCAMAAKAMVKSSAASASPRTMLVLGGTGYLGPALVEQSIAAGFIVTLFNRGKTNPGLFPHLEKIHGNRSVNRAEEDLSGLAGRRFWDIVVDVWPSDPFLAESAAKLLGSRTKHYLYVSSISAYDGYPKPDMDETAPLRTWSDATRDYEPDKAESERRLQAIMGEKLTIIRPGPIMGERGGSPDVFTWLMRARSGGRHIAPGDGTDGVEYVDVKDVGGFLVMAAQRRLLGAYNLTGKQLTYRQFLDLCRNAMVSHAEFVWIPRSFLLKECLRTDRELNVYSGNFPLWRPDVQIENIFRVSSRKAFGAGWKNRSFAATAQDCLLTFGAIEGAPASWKDFLPPTRDQQVLADWTKQSSS